MKFENSIGIQVFILIANMSIYIKKYYNMKMQKCQILEDGEYYQKLAFKNYDLSRLIRSIV